MQYAESSRNRDKNKEKQKIFGDVREIIPSTLNENPCTSKAIAAESRNRLNEKTFLHSKKFVEMVRHTKKNV